MGESHGLRVYESETYRQAAEDRLYAKDAQDFAEVIQEQEYEGGLYRNVSVHLLDDLANRRATKDKILDELNWLSRSTGPQDIAKVFMAGHGYNDELGKHYFLPKDYDLDRAKRNRF